ncbi:MAG TPA: hypothetical protein VFV64_13715 [Permianibacter sp.]|nr:hypothetical protein [Permianibacter sp.]
MNETDDDLPRPELSQQALYARRAALRRQLQCRRQQIALALQAGVNDSSDFPRSHTMRFLSNNPLLAASLLAVLVGVTFRVRLSQVIPPALMLARLLHGLTGNDRNAGRSGLPSPSSPDRNG